MRDGLPRVPDGIEPLVGWRAWTVGLLGTIPPYEYFLVPLGDATISRAWKPGEALAATCTRDFTGDHYVPESGCTCGYWAFRSLEELMATIRPVATHQPSVGPDVIGSVYLWGKVVVAGAGFRAQYAYPRELFIAAALDPHLERTFVAKGLERYGIRVRAAEDLGFVFDGRGAPGSHDRVERGREVRRGRQDEHR